MQILPGATDAPATKPNETLGEWIERQTVLSAAAMLRCISATDIIKDRRGFGQVIKPTKGSVLACPIPASYDPDPDYFFHWLRDSAVIIDALRCLLEAGKINDMGRLHFKDFLSFSLALCDLDGRAFLDGAGDFRRNIEPYFQQFVRPDDDIESVRGERVFGEPRFNPDGTLDIIKWSRPQHDGPALRALAVLRFARLAVAQEDETRRLMAALIARDIDFILAHWREASFDIWEEELGEHYYTRLAQCAALSDAEPWMEAVGDHERAKACRAEAMEISRRLDQFWSPAAGIYGSRRAAGDSAGDKALDIAVLLAVVHAARREGPHSLSDPKVWATLAKLEDLFASSYKINQDIGGDRAPALGRYAGDKYYSGGAYYFSTLGAAEFYFRLAGLAANGAVIAKTHESAAFFSRLGLAEQDRLHDRRFLFQALFRRADQYMATVRAFTPASGELSEQFDQATGAQTSAKSLAWSHAAFITAATGRTAALAAAS
ncbi:glycoside hydrolase family 15 protein [Methylocapsa palsarum]|uniref:glucan 1,4-alpha-glucosidase n=1 Tax=Methylocapsa palsarum TaxID=1612308 RepID=A0A1I3WYG7_9HYPH|nr:glycoside hydrolase family 15 protein [Methylocapsa palsarum]SFK12159.1 glucoamylase [Methylocapsa palsarum]